MKTDIEQTKTPRQHADMVVSEYMNLMGWFLDMMAQGQTPEGTKQYRRLRQLYYTALMLTNNRDTSMYRLPRQPTQAAQHIIKLREIICDEGLYNVGMTRCSPI